MRTVELHHLGRPRVIAAHLLDGVIVDPGPSSCLPALLDALADEVPRALLLTHIHLDHAGASGSLVARYPELEVFVHERGARHLAEPARLLDSARRLYGEDMDRLWGEFLAVPPDRLRVLQGGEAIIDSRFRVAYTPGHASHHVSFLHADGTAFVGDVGGVRIVPEGPVIPPTPPPDIDIEAWLQSLDTVAGWRPERLAMTHFGIAEDVPAHLAELRERLPAFAALARERGEDGFVDEVRGQLAAAVSPEVAAAYTQAAPPDQLYAGLARYWTKRDEGAAVS